MNGGEFTLETIAPAFHPADDDRGLSHDEWTSKGLPRVLDLLDISPDASETLFLESLPFSVRDVTAGSRSGLQSAVAGAKSNVDFPLFVESSSYYKNLIKRAATGDTSRRLITGLQAFLSDNPENIWPNSWVRFPKAALSHFARELFEKDMLADKSSPKGPKRKDCDRFVVFWKNEPHLRVPVSYLLKLALADVIARAGKVHPAVRTTGERLMAHFLNDDVSPETRSFHPVLLTKRRRMGEGVAREALKRFTLSQLLILYANRAFGLSEAGQRAMIYFAPQAAVRQKRFNELISEQFYREIFTSPCLSGSNRGEATHECLRLRHQVLSRSRLHAVAKLREAGIIARNHVMLPTLCNLSLANNGTRVSIGSRKLSRLMEADGAAFGAAEEKYMGDLVVKIVEHFLPLFVGTYSAAPFRIDFWDFHPEKVLGFLPHELDYTHLRMIWRRWKKKACLKVFGHPVTPFGPHAIDRWISRSFDLKGDFVHDYRLLDYFACLMSTARHPALDGTPGNHDLLKTDLSELGIFDNAMPTCLLYQPREHRETGFSGFEGRYYSQFFDILHDMAEATCLQILLTLFAYRAVLRGGITHRYIPDAPHIESERRQIFFGAAIGIPTFYVQRNTKNRFMLRILRYCRQTRLSRRYAGYIRVHQIEYRRALIQMIREEAIDLVEMLGAGQTLEDLVCRIEMPKVCSAAENLTREILDHAGAPSPRSLSGEAFNTAAERYYRKVLRKRQIAEGLNVLEQDLRSLDAMAILRRDIYPDALASILDGRSAWEFLDARRRQVADESLSTEDLTRLISLTVLSIRLDQEETDG